MKSAFFKKRSAKPAVFSSEVKIVIGAFALDFLAWGLIDPFFSVFVNSIFQNILLVGLVVSLRGFVALICLAPMSEIITVHGSRGVAIWARLLTALALVLYIIGGVMMNAVLLFIAAIIQGVGNAGRDVSTREALMTASTADNASTIFGVNFSSRNAAWMTTAALSGFVLVWIAEGFQTPFEEILPFAFAIGVPIILTAGFLIHFRPRRALSPFTFATIRPDRIWRQEAQLYRRFWSLSAQLKFALLLICFLQLIRNALLLFLPLLAFQLELSPIRVGLLMATMQIPLLFSGMISIFEDRTDRMVFVIGGLLFSVIPFILLSQVAAPMVVALLAVCISLALAIIHPANLGIIAAHTPHSEVPKVAALQIVFQWLGVLVGALVLGVISEYFGVRIAFLILAILAIVFAVCAVIIKWRYRELPFPKHYPFRIHPLHPQVTQIHHYA